MEPAVPPPEDEARPVWILYAVFGTSITCMLVFIALMTYGHPVVTDNPVRRECRAHLTVVYRLLRDRLQREGKTFEALLAEHGRGATIQPLIRLLEKEGALPSPPPSTSECKSWKNYTVVDPQKPVLDGLTCFVHAEHPEGVLPPRAPM